ncbi:propionyl-CoA synthetase [Roseibium sp.]|uniref:propionyl-CoA synthetase n=1 Tax=Roseibium sp. TaxID=1936156 RepID=UPI003A96AE7B
MPSHYKETYASWKSAPFDFWRKAAAEIDWSVEGTEVFDAGSGPYGHWFPGWQTNTCYNCLDRHVERGRRGQPALIYDSPITGSKRTYSYEELLDKVQAFSAILQDHDVSKGDRVIIYMPMIPEAVMAMLACARIGAIHSVVFGGFAANELATRIDDATPKIIIAASCGIEPGRVIPYKPLIDKAIDVSKHKPSAVLVVQREQAPADLQNDRDFDLGAALDIAVSEGREVAPVPMEATDPLYILYTSGTTGQPKGVVRDTGGHMVALKWSMENLYGIEPGEVFWGASDVGWVVGHSYIAYGPLLHGCTSILFEGKPVGTPDAGVFWRVISEHQVAALFTAPTAFRAIRKEDPQGKLMADYEMHQFRALFLAGERADPDTVNWAAETLKIPVIDHWWQTETGWCIVGNPMGLGLLPVKPGSPTVPMPGYDVQIVDDSGAPLPENTLGNIVIKLPLPPGSLPTLWNAEDRFHEAYLADFPGFYKTSDAGILDEDGYLSIMSRTDDIINVAGHRLSTGAMEEVLAGHPDVAECAVIGIADKLKGQLPCGFAVLKSGVNRPPEEIEKELVQRVRQEIGPVAAFKIAITVERLPKTRSGKILRATMRQIADSQEVKLPPTIDDPAILDEIAEALASHGILSRS